MLRYVTRRAVISMLMLALASLLIFVMLRVLPGDPVTTLAGQSEGISSSQLAQLRHGLGLDRPLIVQYGSWVAGMFAGHFGTSYFSREPVQALMVGRIGPTIELIVASLLLSLTVSVPMAVFAAMHPRGLIDRIGTGLASLGMSMPSYLAAIGLLIVFAVKLRWLPGPWVCLDLQRPGPESPTHRLACRSARDQHRRSDPAISSRLARRIQRGRLHPHGRGEGHAEAGRDSQARHT